MSLTVVIVGSKNLPNIEKFGKIDPIAEVTFAGSKKKTEVIKDELNPSWNAKFEFDLGGKALVISDSIEVVVKDWEKIGRNRLLGKVTHSLRDVINSKNHSSKPTLKLMDGSGSSTTGDVSLQVIYKPPPGAEGPISKTSAGVEGTSMGDDPDGDEDELEGGEGEEGDEDGGGGGAPGAGGAGGFKKGKRKKRSQLSKKPQDFQVRIKVWEGRQLAGGNIHPVCKVTVSNQTKMTRVKKSTNRPFWDEVFFFNFNKSPAELFDEVINFQVFNSRKLRSDALIGGFHMDVGTVYEEDDHVYHNKWLLLTSPDDAAAGAMGYLMVSMSVIGSGDEAAQFKKADEGDDIESNLLRPAGMQLRKGMFIVKIFNAEDIPQMDPSFFEGVKKILGVGGDEKKEMVDPYLVCKFAGKKVKTEVKECNDHPDWNIELRIPIRFPSMCERIKLQMRDWDRLSTDDYIGTTMLDISTISASGEDEAGYLPTFGPCFVNFYGSTREYSDLPDQFEDLNMGKGEGVAYRGRVMMSIETKLGEHPEVLAEEIGHKQILRVQKFLRRRKYRLYCAFLDANMVSETDDPVEFEVSIGNYGNKLDDGCVPQPSTTQPTNAVFDGCQYYFLPWTDNKPLVVINSDWEDISFRLDTLNILLRKVERLQENMEKVKLTIKAGAPAAEVAAQLINMIDKLVADCRDPIPELDPTKVKSTELDQRKHERRGRALEHIVEEATKLRENATDVQEALDEVEGFLHILQEIAIEPQNSMPDVIIWMISGTTRIAYHRIPAYNVLYSSRSKDACGKFCGEISSFFLKEPDSESASPRTPESGPALATGITSGNIGSEKIPGLLRVKVWLGLEKDSENFQMGLTDSSMAVFAETYENNMSVLGNWTTKMLPRPKWSDTSGKLKLPKDKFELPTGWKWDGDWFISPELSLLYDADAGMKTFLDDCYEHESRNVPGGYWGTSNPAYTTVKGDACPVREEIPSPEGWKWDDVWQCDLNRACDEDGWEFCVEATLASWGACEKTYHLCRRRRWVRSRSLVADPKQLAKKKKESMAEGWEYAPLYGMKFHASERKMDMVRRRRHHRKMVAESPKASAVFSMSGGGGGDSDSDDEDKMSAPRLFLTYSATNKYQLRAYLYQARDLIASDSDSFSDPFAYVSFISRSQKSEVIKHTLCPYWDQTLIYDEIEIQGDPNLLAANPPDICIDVLDFDTFGSNEFLGRTLVKPMVKLDSSDQRVARLAWHNLYRGSEQAGELLASFELFLMSEVQDLPFMPPMRGDLFSVPSGIRPVMQRTGVELLCWGVRNMKKFQLAGVTSPSIEFEIGGKIIESKVIKNTKKNPNFDQPLLFLEVDLPKEELYVPPINIKVRDHRAFGRKPIVGTSCIKALAPYRVDPLADQAAAEGEMPENPDELQTVTNGQADPSAPREGSTGSRGDADASHVVMIPEDEKDETDGKKGKKDKKKDKKGKKGEEGDEKVAKKDVLDDEIDWWSKYYASTGEIEKAGDYLERGYDKLTIYKSELEKVDDYDEFGDFCNTFELNRGKQKEDEESSGVGEFKGLFRIYPLPGDLKLPLPDKVFKHLPPSAPVECVVRIYVVRGIDLQPQDPSGLSDPFLKIKLGKKKINDDDNYIPNTLNPVFGKMFEIKTFLPVHKDLNISVWDHDLLSSDDIIGETHIDLENRFLTKYRATCGLPATYNTTGPNKWRDSLTPMQILEEHCKVNNIPGPFYFGKNKLTMDSKMYNLVDFETDKIHNEHEGDEDQRLALYTLRTLPLVKEHLETRPIFSPLLPGIEQGKLEMFVDIFPMTMGPPGPPIDIMPRQPRKYVLRVVIWNTKDVILDETSITGERMSDIYLKGWLPGQDEKQETDVHYRSLNGEGNFNWRFVFPFEYIPPEKVMVIEKKDHFWSIDKTVTMVPPVLMMQIWDNDAFSPDDWLGTVELNLNHMPSPAKKSRQCSLKQLPDTEGSGDHDMISLFEQKRVNGWWPCMSEETGERELTGKVEMEIELVSAEEADERPAASARDDPNSNPTLEPPNRPETSFNWFMSPWKTLKFIIWNNYKWYIIGGLLLLLLIAFIALLMYSVPGEITRKIFGN